MRAGQRVERVQELTLEQRYERALARLVPEYMRAKGLRRSQVADALGVNRSTFSRFLNRVPGYGPADGRPEMTRILEQVEAVGLTADRHFKLDYHRYLADGASDLDRWFGSFMLRATSVMSENEPAVALELMRELIAQALHAPPHYSAAMCTNLLMRIGSLLDKPGAKRVGAQALHDVLARIVSLEERAVQVADRAFRPEYMHRVPGYAGYSMAWVGILLPDDALLDAGFCRVLDAVRRPQEHTDGHWWNLFELFDGLRAVGHPSAEAWISVIEARLEGDIPEALRETLRSRGISDPDSGSFGREARGLEVRRR